MQRFLFTYKTFYCYCCCLGFNYRSNTIQIDERSRYDVVEKRDHFDLYLVYWLRVSYVHYIRRMCKLRVLGRVCDKYGRMNAKVFRPLAT